MSIFKDFIEVYNNINRLEKDQLISNRNLSKEIDSLSVPLNSDRAIRIFELREKNKAIENELTSEKNKYGQLKKTIQTVLEDTFMGKNVKVRHVDEIIEHLELQRNFKTRGIIFELITPPSEPARIGETNTLKIFFEDTKDEL